MSDTPIYLNETRHSTAQERVESLRTGARTSGSDSRDLLTYWNAMRVDLDLPRRSDIDPRGIAGMLSRTFILEKVAPGLARFRVAGTHFNDLLGMDVRGMPLSALLLPEAREDLSNALEKVFDMPGILRATLVSPGAFRQPELEAELLVLPLRDAQGDVTRAIGCLVAHGSIGKAPRRFAFRHLRVDPISVVKAPRDEEGRHVPLRRTQPSKPAQALHEPKPKFAPLKPGQPAYLRLVLTD